MPAAAQTRARPTDPPVAQRERLSATAPAKQAIAASGSTHASIPTARVTATVVDANAWSPTDANVTDNSLVWATRSGATTARAAAITAPTPAIRRTTLSLSPSVKASWAPRAASCTGPDRRSPPAMLTASESTSGRRAMKSGLARRNWLEMERPSTSATSSSRRISSTLPANVGPSSSSRFR